MLKAAGIDLGGTKSEVQLFDQNWVLCEKRRDATPQNYEGLVTLLQDQICWARAKGGPALPVGLGMAGLNDARGLAFCANHPAMGQPFIRDLSTSLDRPITFVNDCRALALSEAILGAGRGFRTVVSLILGTGVGGGVVVENVLLPSFSGTGGEFGHMPLSARAISETRLPLERCGCGQLGCYETYLAGPGLCRMAAHILKKEMDVKELARLWGEDEGVNQVWAIWLKIAADLLQTLTYTVDADVIIIGGGLSNIAHIDKRLQTAFAQIQLPGFATPPIHKAQGGDASGARGAALAALHAAQGEISQDTQDRASKGCTDG